MLRHRRVEFHVSEFIDAMLVFEGPSDNWDVMIEELDHSAHAYLRCAGRIMTDVWLYNVGTTPETIIPTRDAPPANPAIFVRDDAAKPAGTINTLSVKWRGDGIDLEARIMLASFHLATLVRGSKPGWNALAVADGPLARVLK
jgi:hypothetical protein